jgi:hypothetical protein
MLTLLGVLDIVIGCVAASTVPEASCSMPYGWCGSSISAQTHFLAVGSSIIFLQIYSAVLLFSLGMVLVVARTLISFGCVVIRSVTTKLPLSGESLCIDLSTVGLNKVRWPLFG